MGMHAQVERQTRESGARNFTRPVLLRIPKFMTRLLVGRRMRHSAARMSSALRAPPLFRCAEHPILLLGKAVGMRAGIPITLHQEDWVSDVVR